MQYTTYSNINANFTYNNVWSLLTKFWINEVINKKEYSKIWLTITVNNNKNKSFTLINNLPFNVKDYTDVLIVLRQQFKTINYDDNDVIDSIVLKYYLEFKDNDYKKDLYNTNKLVYIFILLILVLLICSLIILWVLLQAYNIECIDEEILNYASKNIECKESYIEYEESNKIYNKRFIFSPFIELFDQRNNFPSFPSKFIDKNLDEFSLVKPLLEPYDITSDNNTGIMERVYVCHTIRLMKIIYILNNRIQDYEFALDDAIRCIDSRYIEY